MIFAATATHALIRESTGATTGVDVSPTSLSNDDELRWRRRWRARLIGLVDVACATVATVLGQHHAIAVGRPKGDESHGGGGSGDQDFHSHGGNNTIVSAAPRGRSELVTG